MIDFGKIKPGATIYCPYDTFNSAGASVTQSGLAVTDIEIYKDGSVTQRSSDNGYTLLDTDGIDFDTLTGIHGFSISLADNSDAGFYAAGSRYFIVISSVTIDGQTVSFVYGTFTIGVDAAVLDTTIASLSSQTSFTLTAGPAEDDALNGCVCYIHDVASAVQGGFAVVLDYTGASKTVTLLAGTTFTAAATDNISFFPPSNARWYRETAQTSRDLGAQLDAAISSRASQTSLDTVDDFVDTEITDIRNRLPAALTADGNIKADTLRVGGTLQTAGDLAALITLVDDFVDTEVADILAAVDTEVAAIKAKTDQLTFSTANRVDSQVFGMETNSITAGAVSVGAVAEIQSGLSTLTAADINTEMLDVLTVDTHAQPGQETPAATTSFGLMLRYLYKMMRNKKEQTSAEFRLFNDDAATVDQKQAVSDAAGTATRGEITSGP